MPHLIAVAPATGPLVGNSEIVWIALDLGLIALLIVLQPWLLARTYDARGAQPAVTTGTASQEPPASFFQIPYITWFLIHHGIAALALLAIVFLGIDNVIDKGTVSALIGSLLGYALGSAANTARGSTQNSNNPAGGGTGSAGSTGGS